LVHALILDEHGDSEIAVWSRANIGGTPIRGNTILGKGCTQAFLEGLLQQVCRAAYEIIERKGYTNWAIGLVIAHLVRTIQEDQGSVLPITVRCTANMKSTMSASASRCAWASKGQGSGCPHRWMRRS
jgi:L-lactate dehydrogenase